ncbi:adenosylhomocysteine nucleosidase [Mucilaginibacter sp. PPCGB 2223]|nr:adenosylhomocysteine nucleosidase [Mucilaginibacter sp. PPCGB 2223]
MAQSPVIVASDISLAEYKPQNITAILGAFPPEVALIHDRIQQKKELIFQNIRYTTGVLNGRPVVLAQTGMGKVNAAITTALLIEHFNPREVLFTGIAGGVDPDLSPGDLVIGSSVAYHDYGTITPDSMMLRATRNPVSMQENPVYFPSATSLISLAQQVSNKLVLHKIGDRSPKIVTGTIVTGDVFVSSRRATQYMHQKMNAEATEMEGAAIAQTCYQQKVPFLVIRSLSDDAGNKASADVASFYKIAAENSAAMIMAMVARL